VVADGLLKLEARKAEAPPRIWPGGKGSADHSRMEGDAAVVPRLGDSDGERAVIRVCSGSMHSRPNAEGGGVHGLADLSGCAVIINTARAHECRRPRNAGVDGLQLRVEACQ